MPINQTKVYNQLLELEYMNEGQRKKSLQIIFRRDVEENKEFKFNGKNINPNKLEDDQTSLEVLFDHLTCKRYSQSDTSREFDIERSKRLHWVKVHIDLGCLDHCKVFSCLDRNQQNNRDEVRTYIFNEVESYVVILRPYRDKNGYYLLTAYFLDGRNPDKIKKKYKRRFPEVY
ncbi:MAG: hypothetical protein WC615_00085 [Mucilaginibacter sp.]|jgi:hypothetical protein|uniref:hypothetical protein n=1 Tax=Mucilaginibacter sp. TaxID=1882438 RepID=UPI00356B5FE4